MSAPFLTQALAVRSHEHLSVASLHLLSAGLQSLGYPPLVEPYTPERYPAYFKPTAKERQWVTQRLRSERIDPAALLIVIHSGAGAAVKLWRSEAWGYCATRLSQTLAGTNTVHFILSGPLHLAAALGTPPVRMFGLIDPRIFGPWASQEQHTLIASSHRCPTCVAIPCGHLSFPAHELELHPCVKLVSEQRVLDAVAKHFPCFSNSKPLSESNFS